MKRTALFILMLLPASLWARGNTQILKCLGEEEKRFHLKKETGPVYELNQRMIGEILQIPRVEVNPEDYATICQSRQFSEAWKLLELSIRKEKNLFVIPNDVTGMQKSITEGMIDDYVEITREVVLSFIASIQATSPTPKCLKEEIPQLDNFFTEIKYLQEDVDMKILFQGRDQKIFEKLKDYPRAFEKCRSRIKKKPKSPSTEADKKS